MHKEPLTEDTPRKVPAKKNTKKWCKGKVGREHVLVTELDKNGYRADCGYSRYGLFSKDYWFCRHEIKCTNCGKVMETYLGKKCPEYEDERDNPDNWVGR